jgi:hypothetical protein
MIFKYTQNIDSDKPIMCINTHIGNEIGEDGTVYEGIDGSQFQEELLSLCQMGKKSVDVWINSGGGSVVDGFTIFSTILNAPIEVNTYCMGLCASIAGVIFQAGKNRIMSDYGILMMHNPWGGENDKALEAMKKSLVVMLSAKSKLSTSKMDAIMSEETWYDSSQTLKAGLCDYILNTHEKPLEKSLTSYTIAKNYFNNAINNKPIIDKSMNFKSICNRLSIAEVDSEMALLDSIEEIVNKAKRSKAEAEEELDKAKAEFKRKKEEMDALETKCKNLEEEMNEYKAKAETEAKNARKVEAKNLVEIHIKRGAIQNSSLEKWVNLAVNDFEGTKEMLEEIAPSKQAPSDKIDTQNHVQMNGEAVVNLTMANLRNKFNL